MLLSGYVVYNTDTNVFLLAVDNTDKTKYYNNWQDSEFFGEQLTPDGITPVAGKIYTCTTQNSSYRWSGSTLTNIGSSLSLGEVEGTAYPGNLGAQLAALVAQLKTVVDAIPDGHRRQLYERFG